MQILLQVRPVVVEEVEADYEEEPLIAIKDQKKTVIDRKSKEISRIKRQKKI